MSDPYTLYYQQQAQGNQNGVTFRGYSQKGDGLGSFLGSIFRKLMPLLKSGATVVGKQALSTGVHFLRDVINGRSMKESVGERITEAGNNLTKKAAAKMQTMIGSGVGYKNGKRRLQSHSSTIVKRSKITPPNRVRKRLKPAKTRLRDIFD